MYVYLAFNKCDWVTLNYGLKKIRLSTKKKKKIGSFVIVKTQYFLDTCSRLYKINCRKYR